MSLPRLLFYVALGGLLGAVLVWGALALVYGPEVAFVLRVLFSAAVAGVVALGAADPNAGTLEGVPGEQGPGVVTFRGFDRHGAPVELRERVTIEGVREAVRAAEAGEPSPELDRVIAAASEHADRIMAEHYPAGCDRVDALSPAVVVLLGGVPFAGFSSFKIGGMAWPADSLAARHEARTIAAFAPGRAVASASFEVPREDFDAFCAFAAAKGLRPAAPLVSGMLAGDPFAGGRRKRPGQWGWRARMLRARRKARAEQRREREWMRRAQGRQQAVLGGRKGRRAIEQWIGGGS